MIPIRVPVDAPVHVMDKQFTIAPDHPLADAYCQVCDQLLSDGPVVLVFVGIAPEDHKPAGWTTGAAVAIHQACTGQNTQVIGA